MQTRVALGRHTFGSYPHRRHQFRSSVGDNMADASQVPMGDDAGEYQRLIPLLPDKISLLCIARAPLSSHPALALVSRSWRSLLLSPSFYAVRSKLGVSEPILLINVRTPGSESLWFFLHDRRRFVQLPLCPLSMVGISCAAVGPFLYVIGGSNRWAASSTTVQVFDYRSNRWASGPRMSAARKFASAASINGRIYVLSGCHPSSDLWTEVLDGGKWSPIPSPAQFRFNRMYDSVVLDGRFLATLGQGEDQRGVAFDLSGGVAVCGAVPAVLEHGWKGSRAVVDGILYVHHYSGRIWGYDPARNEWKALEGLGRELPRVLLSKLTNLGGILCLVWEEKGRVCEKMMEIECAGIEVSRTSTGGLSGSIVWWESTVFALPTPSVIQHCVVLEV